MVTVGAVTDVLRTRMPSPDVRVTVPPFVTVKVVALDPRTMLPRAGAFDVVEIWICAAAVVGAMMAQAAAAAARSDVRVLSLMRPPFSHRDCQTVHP
ncbi:hypothetical protein [Brevundimonas sp.]